MRDLLEAILAVAVIAAFIIAVVAGMYYAIGPSVEDQVTTRPQPYMDIQWRCNSYSGMCRGYDVSMGVACYSYHGHFSCVEIMNKPVVEGL